MARDPNVAKSLITPLYKSLRNDSKAIVETAANVYCDPFARLLSQGNLKSEDLMTLLDGENLSKLLFYLMKYEEQERKKGILGD